MAEDGFAADRQPFGLETKPAQVAPAQQEPFAPVAPPGPSPFDGNAESVAMKPAGDALNSAPPPQLNGDPEAKPNFLGLHPSLSNSTIPPPAPAPPLDLGTDKSSADIEKPIAHVAEGIKPTAPFLPSLSEPQMDTAPAAPLATSVPPSIEQPTSDVRDEPSSLPPVLDSGITHTTQGSSGGVGIADLIDPPAPAPVQIAEQQQEPSIQDTAVPVAASEPTESLVAPSAPQPPVESVSESVLTPLSEPAPQASTAPEPAPVVEPVHVPTQEPEPPALAPIVQPEPTKEPAPTPVAPVEETKVEDAALTDSAAQVAVAAPVVPAEDVEMTDSIAVESAGNGVVRPREEDESEEPSAKRAKLEEESEIKVDTDFKKPELPALTTDTAVAPTNGSGETPVTATPMTATPLPDGFISVDATEMSPEQKKYLTELMRRAKKTKDAIAYLNPVDPVALNIPTYPDLIKEPMDLSTAETKLKEGRYGSVDEMIGDIELMVGNSRTFNGTQHVVTLAGENLRSYFMKSIKTQLPRKGAPPPVKPVKEKAPAASRPSLPRRESRAANARSPTGTARSPNTTETYALQPDGTPLIRRDSTANDGRPKREIHRPQPKDLPYQSVRPKKKKHLIELKFCQYVLKELYKSEHKQYAFPFYNPVDPVALNIPSYHKVIKKPMDLGTINSNLKNGMYANWKEFKTDMDLIFQNCYKFNPPSDGVYSMGQQTENAFKALWDQREEWVREHAPTPEARSDDEEDDDDDDEEEEEEEPGQSARISQLQEQLAALHAEMSSLVAGAAGGSRKSPTAKGSKKGKKGADAGTKKTKRSGSTAAAASSKPSKPKKEKKIPKLTQEQKREVSEGIGLLDDAGMRKAVQIIRNGVPSLQNVNDDELELDIDEIPEAVVYDLYRFVRSLRPKAASQAEDPSALFDEPADDDYEPPARARGSTAGGAGPGRKKNKPMTAAAQESKIAEIEQKLKAFGGGPGGDAAAASAAMRAAMGSGSGTPDEDEDEDAEGSSSEEE